MDENTLVAQSYALAKEQYAKFGIHTDDVLKQLADIPVSMHCWQGDDVNGFEKDSNGASGGILTTGNYPGRARNPQELRQDLEKAISMLPGKLRLNLHAIYRESSSPVDRDEIKPEHFANWIQWAKKNNLGLDFNPTYFSHPMASSGLTLSSPDKSVRDFWIRHGKACRKIAAEMGKELGTPCVMNTWVPDGFKDTPVDRAAARRRLMDSLDQIFEEKYPATQMRDAVESKLFGIGVESCTIGSHEFYMGYAVKNGVMLCLDAGHFHPTEVISDKISSALLYMDQILLHVSRPVRWDSDHVILFDDELQAIANEIVRNGATRVNIGLDYFDATINRIAAWVVGVRNMQKALCKALLEPRDFLAKLEFDGDYTQRLALTEELKAMPFSAVYDYFCMTQGKQVGFSYMDEIRAYEKNVLANR